jgi:PIN domain nuclease of toxin-antitoxin system
MLILLDTHAFLWAAGDPSRLSTTAAQAFLSSENSVMLSAASIWETAIKLSLGKLTVQRPLAEVVDLARTEQGIRLLPIGPRHALEVESLPMHHRDPFDRLLIAQARCENATIMTRDPAFAAYDVDRLW